MGMTWSLRRKGDTRSVDDTRWLVVGLGNPGPEYSGNRHNVGFMVADAVAAQCGGSFTRQKKVHGLVAECCTREGARLVVLKPNAFMNRSGGVIAAALRYYGVPVSRLVVAHDDLDLPFATLRLKMGGGHGGHNGLRDTIAALGSPDFARVRVGIGRPPGRQAAADFVLRDFSSSERDHVPTIVAECVDVIEQLVADGFAAAQQTLHSSRR